MNNHKYTYKQMKALRKTIEETADKYLVKIFTYITKCLKQAPNLSNKQWNKKLDGLLDIYYDCFTDVYKETSVTLQKLFGKVKDFDPEKIMDLTYSKDGIKFEERISKYWKQAKQIIDDGETWENVRVDLLYHLALITDTESKTIEEGIKKHKKPIIEDNQYRIIVIDGCGGDCNHDCLNYNGIYPEDDAIEWPPYHPGCNGVAYYDVTDDPDEIEDLDLDDTDLDENI